MKRIEQRLREAIGLDASSIGAGAIHRMVRLRMKARSLNNIEAYIALLDSSAEEREELIDSVVVTETWFFRDRDSFSALIRLVKSEWLPQNPGGLLRVLSIPCSTGEEPYSIAMALLEAGLLPGRFRIDAADVSSRALTRAAAGIYTKNSFRGKDLSFRNRYFYKTEDGFALEAMIRSRVSFFQANIVSRDFPARHVYDVIFCRNLLIYFDRDTQKQAIGQLRRMLVSGGVLFVGPAEQPLIADQGFEPLGIALAFASRKCEPSSASKAAQPDAHVYRAPSHASHPGVEPAGPQSQTTRAAKPELAGDGLETARTLADAGDLERAAQLCEEYLRSDTASAQGWYLLGLIRDSAGEPGAAECYRKALYLEPDHYETLLQMALLAQREGNVLRARVFKDRAERCKRKALRVA